MSGVRFHFDGLIDHGREVDCLEPHLGFRRLVQPSEELTVVVRNEEGLCARFGIDEYGKSAAGARGDEIRRLGYRS